VKDENLRPMAKSLAMDVFYEVLTTNWNVREDLKSWKICLERAIRREPRGHHLEHILDMQQIIERSFTTLKSTAEMFAELSSDIVPETLSSIASPRATLVHEPHELVASQQQKLSRSSGWASRSRQHQRAAQERQLHDISAKQHFLQQHSDDCVDLFESTTRLCDQISLSAQLVDKLSVFYRNQQNEKMNRALYILTLVSVLFNPIQTLAGVYGMNFENLPELHYENGYYWWWGINGFIVVMLLFFMKWKHMI